MRERWSEGNDTTSAKTWSYTQHLICHTNYVCNSEGGNAYGEREEAMKQITVDWFDHDFMEKPWVNFFGVVEPGIFVNNWSQTGPYSKCGPFLESMYHAESNSNFTF